MMLVYGEWTDPETGHNFFLIRVPDGRIPWSKKIAPAVNRIVRELAGEASSRWDVEEVQDLWERTAPTRRYSWTGESFERVS